MKSTGLFSAFMSWLFMLCIGWYFTGNPQDILRDLLAFLTASGSYQPAETTKILGIIPFVFLVVAIDFLLMIPCLLGIHVFLGKPWSNSIGSRFDEVAEGPYFRGLFVLVFLEELIFRWFLLGQVSKLPLFSGNAFYVLLLASNALFAYIHLRNYKDSAERQWPRVLPQFLSGMLLSFVFVRYGLVASVFAHFAMNSILFSMHKVQNTNVIDFVRIVIYFVYAFVALHNMDKPIADTLLWFSMEPKFALPGWSLGDYVAFGIFFSSTTTFIADLLLFDKNLTKKTKDFPPILTFVVVIPMMICLLLGIQYGAYWVMSWFIKDFVLCVLVTAVGMTMIVQNASLSAAQRSFWVGIPGVFVTICTIQALGFKGAFMYMMVCLLISIPQIVLEYMDD